jgi:predicted nucleic acid-binding protein
VPTESTHKTSPTFGPSKGKLTVLLDSSAIASIFLKDKFEQSVSLAIQSYDDFLTLDIAFAEVGSAAWKSVLIFKEQIEPVRAALKQASQFIRDNCEVMPSSEFLEESFDLGTKNKIQIYDSLFLAAARRFKVRLLTTNERLHNRLLSIKELSGITTLPHK